MHFNNFLPTVSTQGSAHYYSLSLADELATQRLGAYLSTHIKPGFNLYLQGDLGTGKTTLTRAILRSLGVKGTLRSPSYALLEPYEIACLEQHHPNTGALLHHFDFYRLDQQPLAWKEAGFASAFETPHATVVEWPEYAEGLPRPTILIALQHRGDCRVANIESYIDLNTYLTLTQYNPF